MPNNKDVRQISKNRARVIRWQFPKYITLLIVVVLFLQSNCLDYC